MNRQAGHYRGFLPPGRLVRRATLLLSASSLLVGTLSIADAALASASAPTPTTVTFTTAGATSWTVPNDLVGGTATFTVVGGTGGAGSGGAGGTGAFVQGTINVTAGTTYDLFVGPGGQSHSQANGGAANGPITGSFASKFGPLNDGAGGSGGYGGGGAGGDGSAVATPSGGVLLVAGGGGGGGGAGDSASSGACASTGTVMAGGNGGESGYKDGNAGFNGSSGAGGGAGGGGGTGVGYSSTPNGGAGGTAGSGLPDGGQGAPGGTWTGSNGGGPGGVGASYDPSGGEGCGGGGGGGGGGFGAGGGGGGGSAIGGGGGGGAGASWVDTTPVFNWSVGTDTGAATGANGEIIISFDTGTAPSWSGPSSVVFTTGSSGTATFTVSGAPTPTLANSGTMPYGDWDFAFNSGTGTVTLSGTPSSIAGGVYPISIDATNALGSATKDIALTVYQPPAITSVNTTTFTSGVNGTFQATTAAGTYPAPSWSLTNNPSWLSINPSTGVISGTPPAASSQDNYATSASATVVASNDAGTSTQNVTINLDYAPTFAGTTISPFIVGSGPQSSTADIYANPAPTSVEESGSLPNGVTFAWDSSNDTVAFSGDPVPGSGGSYPVTVTATNSLGTQQQDFVIAADEKGSITSSNQIGLDAQSNVSYSITSNDFYPAPTISETGALPTGLKLAGGVLTGNIPAVTTTEDFPVTFTATNSVGSVTQDATIVVSPSGTTQVCPTGDICAPGFGTIPTIPTSPVTSTAPQAPVTATTPVSVLKQVQVVTTVTPAPKPHVIAYVADLTVSGAQHQKLSCRMGPDSVLEHARSGNLTQVAIGAHCSAHGQALRLGGLITYHQPMAPVMRHIVVDGHSRLVAETHLVKVVKDGKTVFVRQDVMRPAKELVWVHNRLGKLVIATHLVRIKLKNGKTETVRRDDIRPLKQWVGGFDVASPSHGINLALHPHSATLNGVQDVILTGTESKLVPMKVSALIHGARHLVQRSIRRTWNVRLVLIPVLAG